MAVIEVKIATESPTGGDDQRGGREATIIFDVTTDDVNDNLVAVLRDPGIPQYPSSYSVGNDSDPGLFLDNKSGIRDPKSRTKWKVTCNFLTTERDKAETVLDNPLLEPVTRNWRTAKEPIPFERDALGKIVANTLGYPFDPPLEDQSRYEIGIFVRNEKTFDNVAALTFIDHVNADVFADFPAGQVLIDDITADERFHGTIGSYFVVTYTFWAREKGWLREEPNRSFYAVDVPGPLALIRRIKDKVENKPFVEPSLIDKDSVHITSEELKLGSAGGGKDPFYLSFTRFAPTAFGPLGLA